MKKGIALVTILAFSLTACGTFFSTSSALGVISSTETVISSSEASSIASVLSAPSSTMVESAENSSATSIYNNPKISLSEFNRISTGMTHSEVWDIVGSGGTVMSESDIAGYKTVMYTWEGQGSLGANANCMFQNGELVSKAQYGLE